MKKSAFMSDCTEGERETILDFQLSWMLRNVINYNIKEKQPKLYYQCMFLFKKLLDPDNIWSGKQVKLLDIKTFKQWKKTDLLVNVRLMVDKVEEFHVLLFENKYASEITDSQRDYNPLKVKEEYDSYGFDYTLHQYLITCRELNNIESYIVCCQNTDWKVYSIEELIDPNIETESDLFNEFWLYSWDLVPEDYKFIPMQIG